MKRKIQRMGFTEGNYAAILRGDKTQTRRVMNPQPDLHDSDDCGCLNLPVGFRNRHWRWKDWLVNTEAALREAIVREAPYAVGDFAGLTLPHGRWNAHGDSPLCIWDSINQIARCQDGRSVRTVGNAIMTPGTFKRKAARYMPVWACLHFAEIVGVRAERLGEIAWWDAIEEGCFSSGHPDRYFDWRWPGQPREADGYASPLEAYAREWEALHGAGAWERNEWVWVRDFKLCDPPEGTT